MNCVRGGNRLPGAVFLNRAQIYYESHTHEGYGARDGHMLCFACSRSALCALAHSAHLQKKKNVRLVCAHVIAPSVLETYRERKTPTRFGTFSMPADVHDDPDCPVRFGDARRAVVTANRPDGASHICAHSTNVLLCIAPVLCLVGRDFAECPIEEPH